MSLRNTPQAAPRVAPKGARTRLIQILTSLGLTTAPIQAGCGRVDGALPERGQVHTFTADDPCLLDCLEGEMMTFSGKNAAQDGGGNYCVVEDGVCVVDDPNALVDQTVNVKMPITAECGALEVVKADVTNSPMPTSLELGPKVTTFEWKVIGAERGECLDGGTDSDSGTTGGSECQTDLECYNQCAGACIEGSCQLVPPVFLPGAEIGSTLEGEGLRMGSNSTQRYGENGINVGKLIGYQVLQAGKLVNKIVPDYVADDSVVYSVELPNMEGVDMCFEHPDQSHYSEYMPCDDDLLADSGEEHPGKAFVRNNCFYSEPIELRLVGDPNPVN